MKGVTIERCTSAQQSWLELRRELWPDCTDEEHLAEMHGFVAQPENFFQCVAYDAERRPVGFAEASLREDYVNGTSSSPVAFLEGLYVSPPARGRRISRALVEQVIQWARSCGCTELASDTLLENEVSQRVHQALGFTETERVVYFKMLLGEDKQGG
jgi:aminoglycoside 6'-N-acetyltransferase I